MLDRILDLSDNARRALFGLVVLVFIGIAVFAATRGSHTAAQPPAAPSTSSTQVSGSTGASANATSSPAARNIGSSSSTPIGGSAAVANPSALTMPVTADGVTQAAQVATTFLHAYSSYQYNQNPDAVRQTLKDLTTARTGVDLVNAVPTGNAADSLASSHTVITATPQIVKTVSVSQASVVLEVRVDKHTTSDSGSSDTSSSYDLVLVPQGPSWGVQDITPAGTYGSGSGGSD